jgi:hypothetical protein
MGRVQVGIPYSARASACCACFTKPGSFVAALASVAALVALAGCGVKEDAFVSKYVEEECAFALSCYDPAILNFYGWTDADACIAQRGPEIVTAAEGCVYDKKAAKECLKEFDEMACPDGDPLPPAICGQVWDCGAGGDTDGGGNDTDAGDSAG